MLGGGLASLILTHSLNKSNKPDRAMEPIRERRHFAFYKQS